LGVEGNHGVRSVAEDDTGALEVMRAALDADERKMRVGLERLNQGLWRDQIRYAWEVLVEERRKRRGGAFQLRKVCCGKEQGAGK
jgi:hypothetical protein